MPNATCSVDGCGKPARTRGWCSMHHWRALNWGNLFTAPARPTPPSDADRFWPNVDKDGPVPSYAPHLGPCWIWTGFVGTTGYGQFRRNIKAHRWSYDAVVGPIPDGLYLDHLCRVPICVNPSHLEPVTNRTNLLRGDNVSSRHAAQTHCIHGHEFTPENTYWRKHSYGPARQCRQCKRDRDKEYQARRRRRTVA